jgi:hypothetical protein
MLSCFVIFFKLESQLRTRTSMRWPAIESSKHTKRTQSVEWGSSRSNQVIEKMVSAEGIESALKRIFNWIQSNGRHISRS